MPDWLVAGLIVLFGVHLIAFGVLAIKRKERYHIFTCTTFALLVITFSLRLWLPNAQVNGFQLYWVFRVAAWISALVSITMLVRRRLGKRSAAPGA